MQFILTDACWGSPSQSNWDALAWALEPFTSLCKIKKRKRSWLTVFTSFGYNSILDWRTELNYSKTFYFSETFAVTKDACDCCNDRDFIASKIRGDCEHGACRSRWYPCSRSQSARDLIHMFLNGTVFPFSLFNLSFNFFSIHISLFFTSYNVSYTVSC